MGSEASPKRFTWTEVHKHNRFEDCWMVIKGKVYDVTRWIPNHPGGELIIQGAGRDATPFFLSYHPLRTEKVLAKYYIGELENYSPYYNWDSDFYTAMKSRVEEVVKREGLNRDSVWMYCKTALVLLCWFYFYYKGMILGSIGSTFLFGFFHSHVGISIGHDGCHGSYSKNTLVNHLARVALDLIGGSWLVWMMQHNVGHHPHANRQGDYQDEDYDPDARSGFPMLRLTPHFKWEPRYRYQHLYVWFLFPFVGAKWMYGDYKYLSSGKYQTMSFWTVKGSEIALQIFGKLLFLSYSCAVPVYLHGLKGILLSAIVFAVFSYNFSLNFAVNHLTDESVFPDEHYPKERDWAKLQVMTTTNYACDSPFWTLYSGGLNHQIEHHLFPGMCHVYLPKIQPVVKKTCEEFGVPYNCFPDYWTALHSYWLHLKHLGNPKQQHSK